MADDTPTGTPMDWQTAQVHLQAIVSKNRAFDAMADLIATANEAKNWLATVENDVKAQKAELAALKADREAATKATTTAKRMQIAAEQAAKDAQDIATKVEQESQRAIRAAQNAQAGRLEELAAQAKGRRIMLESDFAAQKAALDDQIGAKQATLSEVSAQLEALRARI